jgi:hypothetical protein
MDKKEVFLELILLCFSLKQPMQAYHCYCLTDCILSKESWICISAFMPSELPAHWPYTSTRMTPRCLKYKAAAKLMVLL